MPNGTDPLLGVIAQAGSEVVKAMYGIWGVVPDKNKGSYVFQTDPYPLTGSAVAGGTVTGQIQVSMAGAFVLCRHATYATTVDFALAWTFSGSDRRWTSRQNGGHAQNIGGTGNWPFIYPQPYVWNGGSNVTVTVESLTAASRTIYVDFIGWRVWDVAALDLTRRAS